MNISKKKIIYVFVFHSSIISIFRLEVLASAECYFFSKIFLFLCFAARPAAAQKAVGMQCPQNAVLTELESIWMGD